MNIVEEPWGFLTYEITGEELWNGDGYIIPEERQSGKIDILVNRVIAAGKEQGCKFLCARIRIKSNKVEEALVSHLKRGCLIHSADEDFIYVKKPI